MNKKILMSSTVLFVSLFLVSMIAGAAEAPAPSSRGFLLARALKAADWIVDHTTSDGTILDHNWNPVPLERLGEGGGVASNICIEYMSALMGLASIYKAVPRQKYLKTAKLIADKIAPYADITQNPSLEPVPREWLLYGLSEAYTITGEYYDIIEEGLDAIKYEWLYGHAFFGYLNIGEPEAAEELINIGWANPDDLYNHARVAWAENNW